MKYRRARAVAGVQTVSETEDEVDARKECEVASRARSAVVRTYEVKNCAEWVFIMDCRKRPGPICGSGSRPEPRLTNTTLYVQ